MLVELIHFLGRYFCCESYSNLLVVVCLRILSYSRKQEFDGDCSIPKFLCLGRHKVQWQERGDDYTDSSVRDI